MGVTQDNSGTSREMTLEEQLIDHRYLLSKQLHYLTVATERKAEPPVVQEIVLARRALEDARMRLGVALTLVKGNDPSAQEEPAVRSEA